jgi:hypothetical protein
MSTTPAQTTKEGKGVKKSIKGYIGTLKKPMEKLFKLFRREPKKFYCQRYHPGLKCMYYEGVFCGGGKECLKVIKRMKKDHPGVNLWGIIYNEKE